MPAPSEDRILTAAESVFVSKGFGACSLRDILSAAECSTTAFYARFASKDAVLETLIRQLLGDLHDTAADALPRTADLVEGWDVGVELLVTALRDRKGLVKVALSEAAARKGPRRALGDTYGLLAALLCDELTRVSGRLEVEVADAQGLAWAIVGSLNMQVMRWAVFEQIQDDALAEALKSTARALLPARKSKRRRPAPR